MPPRACSKRAPVHFKSGVDVGLVAPGVPVGNGEAADLDARVSANKAIFQPQLKVAGLAALPDQIVALGAGLLRRALRGDGAVFRRTTNPACRPSRSDHARLKIGTNPCSTSAEAAKGNNTDNADRMTEAMTAVAVGRMGGSRIVGRERWGNADKHFPRAVLACLPIGVCPRLAPILGGSVSLCAITASVSRLRLVSRRLDLLLSPPSSPHTSTRDTTQDGAI